MRTHTTNRSGRFTRFNAETVGRALDRHQERGLIRSWRAPGGDQKKWRVDVFDYGWFEGTIREVHALGIGLMAATKYRDRQDDERTENEGQ